MSIRNYISGVWYHQKMLGFPDYSSSFMLIQTLNGIERSFDYSGKAEKYPLTAVDLLEMYKLLDMSVFDDALFWISALICFRGLLRVGHVTASAHNIKCADVLVSEGFIVINILSSKTDQFGSKPFPVILHDMPGSPLCVRGIVLLLLKGSSKEDCLVSHMCHGKKCPSDYAFINDRLKSLSSTINIPVARVSTHSFRHGGATMLKSLGVPVESIMIRGNWKSSAVFRYLHQSTVEMLGLEQVPCNYMSKLSVN